MFVSRENRAESALNVPCIRTYSVILFPIVFYYVLHITIYINCRILQVVAFEFFLDSVATVSSSLGPIERWRLVL